MVIDRTNISIEIALRRANSPGLSVTVPSVNFGREPLYALRPGVAYFLEIRSPQQNSTAGEFVVSLSSAIGIPAATDDLAMPSWAGARSLRASRLHSARQSAITLYDSALQKTELHPFWQVKLRAELAETYASLGNEGEASKHFGASLELAERQHVAEKTVVPAILLRRGHYRQLWSDAAAAFEDFSRSAAEFDAAGDDEGSSLARLGLAELHLARGTSERAGAMIDTVLRVPLLQARWPALYRAALLLAIRQGYENNRIIKALNLAPHALTVCRAAEDRHCLARASLLAGKCNQEIWNVNKALDFYSAARAHREVAVEAILAEIRLRSELSRNYSQEQALLREIQLSRASGDSLTAAYLLIALGSSMPRSFARTELPALLETRREYLMDALSLYRAFGHPEGEARALLELAQLASITARLVKRQIPVADTNAVKQLAAAYQIYVTLGRVRQARGVALKIADYYRTASQLKEASDFVAVARSTAPRCLAFCTLEQEFEDIQAAISEAQAASENSDYVRAAASSLEALRQLDRSYEAAALHFGAPRDYEFTPRRRLFQSSFETATKLRVQSLMNGAPDYDALTGAIQAADTLHLRRTLTRSDEVEPASFERDPLVVGHQQELLRKLARIAATALSPEDRELQQRAIESRLTRLNSSTATATAMVAIRQPDLAAIQKSLAPSSIVVKYYLSEPNSFAWIVSHDKVDFVLLAGERHLVKVVGAVGAATKASSNRVSAVAAVEFSALLDAAAEAIWHPVCTKLGNLENKSRVIVVPDGPLHQVPFGALKLSSRSILLRHFDIVTLPSLSVLQTFARSRSPSGRTSRRSVLLVADPVYSSSDPRFKRALSDGPKPLQILSAHRGNRAARSLGVAEQADLPRLPFSRLEVDSIAQLMPNHSVVRLTGFEASVAKLRSLPLDEFEILHFAAHGVANDQQPGASGLLLSFFGRAGNQQEGLLAVRDIHRLRLDADLVVLSACQSGLGRVVRGEGVVSLGSAFLAAGARWILTSLWQIDDQATAALMRRFYQDLMSGRDPSAALRSAQLSVASDPRWANPYYWAGFTVQGDWRESR